MFENFKMRSILVLGCAALALAACNGGKAKTPDAPFDVPQVSNNSTSETAEGNTTVTKTGYIMLLNSNGGHVGHFKVTAQVVQSNAEESDDTFDSPLVTSKDGSVTFTTDEGQNFRWEGEYMYSDTPFSMTFNGIQYGWSG